MSRKTLVRNLFINKRTKQVSLTLPTEVFEKANKKSKRKSVPKKAKITIEGWLN